MKFICTAALLALSATVAIVPAKADAIPYPHAGTVAPNPTLVAVNTGNVVLYYAGGSAGDTDEIELYDINSATSTGYIFDNQTTAVGTTATLAVTAGDSLEVFVDNLSDNEIYSSIAANSHDGKNHVYATAYTATDNPAEFPNSVPPGTFIGVEDAGDFDYNDVQFVFTNLAGGADTATPEPATFALIGLGLAGIAGIRRSAQSKKN